jgi:phosphatidate cytidylyltransferase
LIATRAMAGSVLLAAMLAVILFAPVWALPIAVSVISALAVHEILHTTGFVRHKRLLAYAVIFSLLIPFWVFFDSIYELAVIGVFIYVFFLFIECITGTKDASFEKVSGIFFASIVLPFFLSSIVRIHGFENGRILVLIPILSAFGSDVFALLFGLKFGRSKLCPEISPNKTVEGSIAGLVMGTVTVVVFGFILQRYYGFMVNYLRLVLYGLAGAFSGQIGDLSMSFVKRQFHIKDFGKIIPGHGGILDRFDSVLFAAPVTEILILLLPAIGK